MLGQMSSRRRVPQHLPSGRGVSGHYSFRTPSVMANVLRTMHATAFSIQTRSVRAFCFGTQRVSYRRRVSKQMSSGRRVPRHLPSGRGVSGHYSFRTPSIKANVLRTTRTTASAFWTRSVRTFFLPDPARVLRTQSVTAIFFQTERVKANIWTTPTMAHDT